LTSRRANSAPPAGLGNFVLYEGRADRIHVIYDGPVTTGGRLIPGAREQFATVILARVSTSTWQRLAPIVDPARHCHVG
jgi:hypothetical protein